MKTNINLPLYHVEHSIYPFIEGAFLCKSGKYLNGFFLVDSGSSDNILNQDVVRLLTGDSISGDKRLVCAVNNEGEECELADVKIKIGDIECTERFGISHNLDFKSMFGENSIIGVLGAGFMRQHGLVLDYAQQCVRSSELTSFSEEGKIFVCPMNAGFHAYGIPLVCLTKGEDDFFCVADSGCSNSALTQYAMEKVAISYERINGQQTMFTISGEETTNIAKVNFSLLSINDDEIKSNLLPNTDVFLITTGQKHICWCDNKNIPPISGLISSEFMLRNKWILDFNVGYIYAEVA